MTWYDLFDLKNEISQLQSQRLLLLFVQSQDKSIIALNSGNSFGTHKSADKTFWSSECTFAGSDQNVQNENSTSKSLRARRSCCSVSQCGMTRSIREHFLSSLLRPKKRWRSICWMVARTQATSVLTHKRTPATMMEGSSRPSFMAVYGGWQYWLLDAFFRCQNNAAI